MLTPRRSPLPEILTATRPPPATPSTSMRSSSACIASIFDFSSFACFIRPRKSGIVVTLDWLFRHVVRTGGCRAGRSHIDDLSAGKTLQHRLHQGIGADIVFQLSLARV